MKMFLSCVVAAIAAFVVAALINGQWTERSRLLHEEAALYKECDMLAKDDSLDRRAAAASICYDKKLAIHDKLAATP